MKELIQFHPGSVKKALQGVTSADLWKAPVDLLRVHPDFNVRIKDAAYKERVRWIANSILANGYMADKPIAGYVAEEDGEHVIYITDGHTRHDALHLAISEGAEIAEVPVVTKPRGTSMEDLTVALVTSNSGQQLSPFEVGTVCKRLIGYGMEPVEIAKRLSMSRKYIDDLLDLVAAPKAIRDMVTTGKVSASLAVETMRNHGKEAVKVLGEGAVVAQASGKERVTKKHVKKVAPTPVKKAPRKAVEPTQGTLPGVDSTEDAWKTQVVTSGQQWIIDQGVEYDDRFALMLAHITGLSLDRVRNVVLADASQDNEL